METAPSLAKTQAVRLSLRLSQKRGSVREDATLQNQLRKCCSGRWPSIEHNTRRQMHGRENGRSVIAEFDLADGKEILRCMRDREDAISGYRLATRKISRVGRFWRLFSAHALDSLQCFRGRAAVAERTEGSGSISRTRRRSQSTQRMRAGLDVRNANSKCR